MKKSVLLIFSLFFILANQACTSEKCAVKGKWKVKSADVQPTGTASLPSTILIGTQEEFLSTIYEFTKDGKFSMTSNTYKQPLQGTYQYNSNADELGWTAETQYGTMNEKCRIEACTGGEITLTQRVPADTTKAQIMGIKLVLTKAE